MVKKILPIFISAFILYGHLCSAQKYEFGLGLGAVSYSGDLYRGYNIIDQSFGIQGIARVNTSQDVAWKVGFLYGGIKGDDNNPIDILGEQRQASFERKFLEVSTVFEYHFIDYKNDRSLIRWSPYLFAGAGVAKFFNTSNSDYNSIQPILPFGLGFKHLIGKQFTASIEFGARKTFFDELDEVSDGDVTNKNYQFGNPADDDWYYHFGISISWILYKIPCTYQYVPNKSMY
ncbi:type IX secretion system protein PorG [Reichenbachiella versicolor]|uniref:type IX secretion system protein PorG n=1 Tax=Reichenbachiella versicolor TaxID=1821036 RepID=UPI000D6E16AD|nr:DUF6089 family protein [Reichenbachiella versicolor]